MWSVRRRACSPQPGSLHRHHYRHSDCPGLLPPPAPEARISLPGRGTLWSLPGNGDALALTLDDGVDSDVVRMYTQFAKDTGLRFTYFVNGRYHSWTDHKDLIRPLVDSGQIQLGNHTFNHPDLTRGCLSFRSR